MSFTFPNSERLKSRKQIAKVFAEGQSLKAYPLRPCYLVEPYDPATHDAHVQMSASASKRFFKTAVDRNRIKRVIRECYRLEKAALISHCQEQGLYLSIMFLYIGRDMPSSVKTSKSMRKALNKLLTSVTA